MNCCFAPQKFKFGSTSKSRLDTCHPVLRKILTQAIKTSRIDFGVVCGYRGKQDQTKAYKTKKSKAKWGESDHNFRIGDRECSLAVDVAPYCSIKHDYIWNDPDLWLVLSNHLLQAARSYGHKLEWGGRYKSFNDSPHFGIML